MRRVWKWLTLSLKVLLAAAVLLSLFSYAMFQGNFVSWFLFYSVVILLLLMGLYALIPLGRFHVERQSGTGAMPAGEELTTEVVIERKWRFPFLYLTVEDRAEEALTRQLPFQAARMIFYPTMERTLRYTYVIPELKRGRYQRYGVEMSTSDMFGFFERRTFVPKSSELLVYPRYHNIERWEAYERHDTETKMSLQDFIEDQSSIAGAREYVPGDKLTSLDWKASARSDKLMTKEFEEYVGRNFLLVFHNFVPDETFASSDAYEKGIELITSLIMYAYKEHLEVGLWSIGAEDKYFPTGPAVDRQKSMITYLAEMRPGEADVFAARFKAGEDDIPAGVTMVLVSVTLDDSMLERMKQLLGRRVKLIFALMDKGTGVDAWEYKRLKELRSAGAEAYLFRDGHWTGQQEKG
ncbi:DUF58 domain-containing protein [Alkalicoccus chagannorensis]|uniref:DUF58 domain-containing protein n=1 Tax=Alkalicoccus chagannorensis TaxID=427072 RepID=UPI00040F5276|nr:DUF58 domain-containing protein [Alkalicoccus chagannorensis]